jgi:hypothetical protein
MSGVVLESEFPKVLYCIDLQIYIFINLYIYKYTVYINMGSFVNRRILSSNLYDIFLKVVGEHVNT